MHPFARWRVSEVFNFVTLGQITEKSNRARTETRVVWE